MGRPAGGYRVKGKQVPGVTSIAGLFGDKSGLIHWAWRTGFEGGDYKKEAKAAADVGKRLHELFDLYPDGLPDSVSVPEDLAHGYYEWLNWRNASKLTRVEAEVSLVSQKHHFGGTIDEVSVNELGEHGIVDWKSGRLYPDQLFQLGGYKVLWDENRPDTPVRWGLIGRFNPKTGDCLTAKIGNLDFAADGFLHLVEARRALMLAKDIL